MNDYYNILNMLFSDTNEQKIAPYNVTVKGNQFEIELSVPGYSEQDITVKIEDTKLVIEGKLPEKEKDEDTKYLFQNFKPSAHFKNAYRLDNNDVINNVTLKNGVLTIHGEHVIPEALKPRVIAINSEQNEPKAVTAS